MPVTTDWNWKKILQIDSTWGVMDLFAALFLQLDWIIHSKFLLDETNNASQWMKSFKMCGKNFRDRGRSLGLPYQRSW